MLACRAKSQHGQSPWWGDQRLNEGRATLGAALSEAMLDRRLQQPGPGQLQKHSALVGSRTVSSMFL